MFHFFTQYKAVKFTESLKRMFKIYIHEIHIHQSCTLKLLLWPSKQWLTWHAALMNIVNGINLSDKILYIIEYEMKKIGKKINLFATSTLCDLDRIL